MQALTLLLAAVCWAAPKAAPARVQLSLDLRPPAAAAPSFAMPSMPLRAAEALKGGQAVDFHRALLETGHEIPEGDDVQRNLAKEGADRAAADEAYFASLARAEGSKKGRKVNYAAFLRAVNMGAGIAEALKAAGYTHLYGEGGVRIPLAEASPGRLLGAHRNTLRAARRQMP